MRLGATSPVISIDPENEAVNWLWYCSPAYRDEDYLPAARARPGRERAGGGGVARVAGATVGGCAARPFPVSPRRRPVLG